MVFFHEESSRRNRITRFGLRIALKNSGAWKNRVTENRFLLSLSSRRYVKSHGPRCFQRATRPRSVRRHLDISGHGDFDKVWALATRHLLYERSGDCGTATSR